MDSEGMPVHLLLVEYSGARGGYDWYRALEDGGGHKSGDTFAWLPHWTLPWPR